MQISPLYRAAGMALLSFGLVACGTPRDFETPPVVVSTPKGDVICQLYTREITAWDRSIGRPDSMSGSEADAYCVAEGRRQIVTSDQAK